MFEGWIRIFNDPQYQSASTLQRYPKNCEKYSSVVQAPSRMLCSAYKCKSNTCLMLKSALLSISISRHLTTGILMETNVAVLP